MDFVATNLGLNAGYNASPQKPFVVYHGDLDGDGRREIIETEREDGLIYPRRNLATLNSAMPWLSEHLLNYDHYAQFTVEEFSEAARLTKAVRSEITTLQS